MTQEYLDPTLAAELTAELEDMLDELEPDEAKPSIIIRDERRRYERMNERRYVRQRL